MDPRDIAMGVKLLQEAWQPSNQYAETQSMLTDEETRLLNQLRAGEPCVICGTKGVHVVEACICKFVKKERAGALFWKKNTHYFDRRSVAAPLCPKHYSEAKRSEIVKRMRWAVPLICVLAAATFSCLMLLLKQNGYSIIPVDDDGATVGVWFWVGIVGFAILFKVLRLRGDKGINFESVWKCGPLKRLKELQWIKCDEQLIEAKMRGG